jgi:hypothetical protein
MHAIITAVLVLRGVTVQETPRRYLFLDKCGGGAESTVTKE